MTTYQLYKHLEKLMNDYPNTKDDEIYYYDSFMVESIDKVEIEYDIDTVGRYICLK